MPYVGAKDPETHTITVNTVGGFDLSAVTSVESMKGEGGKLTIKPPKGAPRSWSWAIQSQTATSLVLIHSFAADGSDVTAEGDWIVLGCVNSPAGKRRLQPHHITFERYGK